MTIHSAEFPCGKSIGYHTKGKNIQKGVEERGYIKIYMLVLVMNILTITCHLFFP